MTKRSSFGKSVGLLVLVGLLAGAGVAQDAPPLVYSGPQSVFIEWAPLPEYDVQGYHVWRTVVSATGVAQGSRIQLTNTPVVETEYQDESPSGGVYYAYEVQPVRAGGVLGDFSEASDPVQAQYLTVFVPDISVNLSEDSLSLWNTGSDDLVGRVRIPISTRCAYELSASGWNIVVKLPNDLLVADSKADIIVESSAITYGLPREYNIVADGDDRELHIVSADASVGGRSLYGTGVLFHVYAFPRELATGCGSVDLVEHVDYLNPGVRIYDTNIDNVDLVLENGLLCLNSADCLQGDVNMDGTVDADDVQMILDIKTGLVDGNDYACTYIAGDINLDRRVDSADAVLVQRWLAEESLTPSSEDVRWMKENPKAKAFTAWEEGEYTELSINEISGNAGEEPVVTLTLDAGENPLPLAGFSVTLGYPLGSGALSFVSAEAGGDLPQNAVTAVHVNELDTRRGAVSFSVSLTDAVGQTGAVELGRFRFRIAADAPDGSAYALRIQEFEAHDAFGYTPRHNAPGQPKAQNNTGSILVALTDEDSNQDISGADVRLDISGKRAFPTEYTGEYRVVPLAPGSYALTASADRYEDAHRIVSVQNQNETKVSIKLACNEGECGDGACPDGEGTLVCAVRDASSLEPILDATVSVSPANQAAVTENTNGYYTMESLCVGNYTITVSAAKYAQHTEQVSIQASQETALTVLLSQDGGLLSCGSGGGHTPSAWWNALGLALLVAAAIGTRGRCGGQENHTAKKP